MIQTWSFLTSIIYILTSLPVMQSEILINNPVANISSTWINSVEAFSTIHFQGIVVRPILIRLIPSQNMAYACGFFCNGLCENFLFSVFILITHNVTGFATIEGYPQVVWSANRNYPVQINATLQLTSEGDLILRDASDELVWSTNTAGRSVSGLNMSESGNLVLFDANNSVVWQTFDHPTDSLVAQQKVRPGLKLIASVSKTNWSEGLYSYAVTNEGWFFFIGSNPPEIYHYRMRRLPFNNRCWTPHILEPVYPAAYVDTPGSNSTVNSFAQLGSDGHLRQFELDYTWKQNIDFLQGELSTCLYPMVCGEYGVCRNGECSCPQTVNSTLSYFRQTNVSQPNLGCSQITPLDCGSSDLHSLVEVEQVSYFTFRAGINNTDLISCKKACLASCSCKASMFRHGKNSLVGDCYLPSQMYSLMDINEAKSDNYSVSIFLKVRKAPVKASSGESSVPVILGLTFGALLSLVTASVLIVLIITNRICHNEVEEEYLDGVPGNLARFSFEELKSATENYNKKLGEGGFGSVFQGLLKDGTKIAVKSLDGVGQVKNSFLTEVESIGNIHHVNLVRLIGYCAEKSHRLLVYEYMANGSLDKWIDSRTHKFPLDWKCRRKIALDIAKGLAYLHEDCRQKIIHLDVKPENILLDENFNAKLSDFGLSKLLSRDQSKIITTLRGTPGYLAPEWLSSTITEKADVYSFGVVVMEILCGRKVFDACQPEDQIHLLSVFTEKTKKGQLLDMVDECCEDMQSNGEEVVKMMQVAAWCLQNEFSIRPSMSSVVKVLEGVVDIDLTHLDYCFISPLIFAASRPQGHNGDDTLIFPSVLSGPR